MIIIKILFFFLLAIVMVLLLAAVIGFSYLRKLMSKGNTRSKRYTYTNNQGNNYNTSNDSSEEDKISKAYAEKIFDKDEGEYVDFEEIPDNTKK